MIKLKKYGDRILREVAQEVTSQEISQGDLCKKMYNAYTSIKRIQGLAAPQIGISKRVIVCRIRGIPIIMYNPEIIKLYGNRKSNEGCESVKGRYIVERPLLGKVKYKDASGRDVCKWYRYKWLRIICHEIDHLNGICICEVGEKV